jgi:hypothetical protein
MYDAHKMVGSNPTLMGWIGFLTIVAVIFAWGYATSTNQK